MVSASDSTHWADQRERGSPLLMRLTAWAARHLGRRAVAPVVWLVVLYFYLTGRRARLSIARYQARLAAAYPQAALPRRAPVYRQYLAFAAALLDKLDAWQGRIRLTDVDLVDPDDVHRQMAGGAGQLLVGAHLGNIEICRALAEREQKLTLNVLVHNKHAQAFNRLLGEAGAEHLRLIEVSELDAARMLELAQAQARGEWIAIAGDRVPLTGERTVDVDFLGARAPLPQGPWLLAGLLGCPVNLLTCTRQDGRYRIELARLTDGVRWTRSTREREVARWAQAYADRLAQACAGAPLQWFNFYPFWRDDAQPRRP
ncbi:glycosyl transferase [Pseudothauera rhizosphaerae]|uniref:Glycosyl transferase n=2 Tax=Pseudothauera rhizosphaerae TaxID=2565932 RepID=A0A4S4AU57_9RHOO|nr:glycosyl transferase [Pseudothauera rhizosphaerae]